MYPNSEFVHGENPTSLHINVTSTKMMQKVYDESKNGYAQAWACCQIYLLPSKSHMPKFMQKMFVQSVHIPTSNAKF